MPKKYKFQFNWVVNGKLAIGTCPRYEEDLIKIKENHVKSIFGLCDPSEAIYPDNLQTIFKLERYVLPDHKSDTLVSSEDLLMARNTLNKLLQEGAVFLHCVAAMERSPLVCMAWLIKHKKLSITQSLDYMMSINKGTNPLPSQLKVLNDPILK